MPAARPLMKPSLTLQPLSQPNTSGNASPIGEGCTETRSPSKSGEKRGSGSSAELFVMVDYPISANRYWRNFKGRMVVSSEARLYKQHVALLWGAHGKTLRTGPVEVSILLHPKLTKDGKESRVLIDLDNCIKVAIDALNGVAFIDDKQVRKLSAEVADPIEGGALSVMVRAV